MFGLIPHPFRFRTLADPSAHQSNQHQLLWWNPATLQNHYFYNSVRRPKKVYCNWLHNLPHTHETEVLYNQLEKESWGPEIESGIQQPPNKRVHGKVFLWLLQVIWRRDVSQLFWATWMKFRPNKSQSMIIRNRKLTKGFKLHLQEDVSHTHRNNITSTEK